MTASIDQPGYFHVVMWHLKPSAMGRSSAENAAVLKEKLETLRGNVPGLQMLQIGIDERRRGNSADLVMIGHFSDRSALEAYHDHPLHAAIKPLASEIREQSVVVDFSGEPAMAAE